MNKVEYMLRTATVMLLVLNTYMILAIAERLDVLESRTKVVRVSASCLDSKGQPCNASFYVIGAKVESGKGE